MDIIAHADLVAVIDDGRAGHGEQQIVHQLDAAAIAFQQRGEAAANTEIEAGTAIGGIGFPQIVALGVGHHFQREFVVVAQEDGPLAGGRNVRGLAQDVGNGEAVFPRDGHVHARHQREVECHVAFVAVAEILLGVLRPLVGFRQQHAVRKRSIDRGADLLQHGVGFRQIFVVGAFPFHEVGDRIQPQPVDAHGEPVAHDGQDFAQHPRIVEIQIRLMRIEAMPVIGAGDLVPGPVGSQRVDKDDAGGGVFVIVRGPDIEITELAARL